MEKQNTLHKTQIPPLVRRRFIKNILIAKVTGDLLGTSKNPLNLNQVSQWMKLEGHLEHGKRLVSLGHVVGTRGECTRYDRTFRPKEFRRLQTEWEYLGGLILQGYNPSPLLLYQWGEAFFALDENDWAMISVLKAFGWRSTLASVVGPKYAPAPPPTIAFLEYWESEVG